MTVIVDDAPTRVREDTEAPSPVLYQNDEEKFCKEMVSKLSDPEKETAAKTSYSYMSRSLSGKRSTEERDNHAAAMALRHLRAEKGDQDLALKKMQSTIAHREEIDVDGLRRCFYELEHPDEATANQYDEYRKNIRIQMGSAKAYVRGYDKKGRVLYSFVPRRKNSEDPEWYLKGYVYMMERALACTERKTGGAEDKVIVLFDYSGYKSAHSPPLSLAKKLVFLMSDHYPERLEHVFVLDAPLAFRAFWILIRPFIDPVTKAKVMFLTGKTAKSDKLGGLIEKNQAESFMLQGGKMPSDIDMESFLSRVPFDHAANEAQTAAIQEPILQQH
uniref:CRAL-TRIO domain-containing protein n=1 Tax=Pseudictyota dubia TaxID=2749911 RepID=A0A7R9VFR1_9STRA|eukprot:CAMPEP_0197450398 /NCGR_PEP_ID=MMETSP1175-20131217/25227_1 /TAXON_ID=1003142 /ORGANISM="Triceratium dubium, Strain CCMP147" /LENGTH=330 /DNA_ID=CAMNT_0042982815 /DNA_START=140 /DNA_END=1132 /DNA_ORIENTATION=+